jgi:hypothetical protein
MYLRSRQVLVGQSLHSHGGEYEDDCDAAQCSLVAIYLKIINVYFLYNIYSFTLFYKEKKKFLSDAIYIPHKIDLNTLSTPKNAI